jgi:hypothetical protein
MLISKRTGVSRVLAAGPVATSSTPPTLSNNLAATRRAGPLQSPTRRDAARELFESVGIAEREVAQLDRYGRPMYGIMSPTAQLYMERTAAGLP